MTTIRLIADDLTGALDAAVQFTGDVAGLPVLLGCNAQRGGPAARASAAISTAGRDLDAASAAALIARVGSFLGGADIPFLKIDSLLRGHWPADLGALLGAYPGHVCIFAPAFPAQRRIMQGGRQFAPGPDGTVTRLPVVPRALLAASGCRVRLCPAGAGRNIDVRADPGTVLVCDAIEQADLDRLVAAAQESRQRILWCGSAGLARALARKSPRTVRLNPGPTLILNGSDHPVTRAQIAAVPESAATRIALDADSARAAARISRNLSVVSCLVAVELPAVISRSDAARVIAERLRATLPHLAPPRCLVVIGGETLGAVCCAVRAEALRLDGELAPGVPCSRLEGGVWDGAPLISRSGAFGDPTFFADLLASA